MIIAPLDHPSIVLFSRRRGTRKRRIKHFRYIHKRPLIGRFLFDVTRKRISKEIHVDRNFGLYYGFVSIPFLMVLIFTMITMFDAAGVRRSAGRQAAVLNKMLDDLYQKGQVPEPRLKELLGHTPFEVFAGAFLGVLTSLLVCR